MSARRAAWLTGAWPALVAAQLAHAQPASPPVTTRTIHVIMNDFLWATYGPPGLPADVEKNRRAKNADRNFALVERELPHLDIRALVHETFCRELAGSRDAACPQVVVRDRPASVEARHIDVGPEGALIVTFAFEYQQGIGADGFRVVAAWGAPEPDRAAETFLQIWYMTMSPKEIRASPLVAAEQANHKEKASRAYWWAGTPSRIETELRRGVADIAGIARIAIPHLGPDAPEGARSAWLRSLPNVGDLKAAGKKDCRGANCDFGVVGVSEDRYWWEQAGGSIISSIPLKPAS